jgi:16S rRNA (adenine1518-N6/adenine1519-N6)-dimethyltransferase
MQEEMAIRVSLAMPRTPDYRAMSLFVQFYSEPKYLFKISRNAFYPKPGVDSAFVHFHLLPEVERLQVSNPPQFWALVQSAFSQRRKTLRNSLKSCYAPDAVVQSLKSLGLSEMTRAEELTLTEFVSLFSMLETGGPAVELERRDT